MVTELPSVLGLSAGALERWTPRPPFRVPNGTTFRFTGPLFAHLNLPIPDDVDAFWRGRIQLCTSAPPA